MDKWTKKAQEAAQKAKEHADRTERYMHKDDMDGAEDSLASAQEHAGHAVQHALAAHALANGKDAEKHFEKAKNAYGEIWEKKGQMGDHDDGPEAHENVHKHIQRLAAKHGYTPAAQAMEDADGHALRATRARYEDI